MKEQDKEVVEIKLVLAMIGLMGWLKDPNDNEGEIKELIYNVVEIVKSKTVDR
ncbi:MAG: hypothetical protein J6V70_07345 [Kiritimatiellae bacterium]|nr:hypothetical protein [Kiritimatiellia bacterium]